MKNDSQKKYRKLISTCGMRYEEDVGFHRSHSTRPTNFVPFDFVTPLDVDQ